MRETHYYNIHNILKFQLKRSKIFDVMRDLNLKFSFFEVPRVKNADLIINLEKFAPGNQACKVIDKKFYVKKDYIYSKDVERNAKWEMEIRGLESRKTTLNFDGSIRGLHKIVYPHIFSQNFLVRSILVFKMLQLKYLLLHAASVSNGKRSFMFIGRGGADKTTLAMDFIRDGYLLQGDDWVILKKDKIFSFPTHFLEFNYRSLYLPTENLRGKTDLLRLIKYLNQRVDYKDLSIKVDKKRKLDSVFMLLKSSRKKLKVYKKFDREKFFKRILFNNMIEDATISLTMGLCLQGFMKYAMAYSLIYPNSKVSREWEDFSRLVHDYMENFPFFILEMPSIYTTNTFKKIKKLIEN